jgi:hypothetical protein
MYGKLFSSMFEGSLYGKGWGPFLVMCYAIANGRPDKQVGMQVDLNPKALADKFGEREDDVAKAIDFLCKPDPQSTSEEEEGRRLVKLGTFAYKVVNGVKYRDMVNEENRRAAARIGMRQLRQKKKPRHTPYPGEGIVRAGADTAKTAEMVNSERGFGGGI